MTYSTQILYLISLDITKILSMYLNQTERRFPFFFLSFQEYRKPAKKSIILVLNNLKSLLEKEKLDKIFDIDLNRSVEFNIINIVRGYEKFLKLLTIKAKKVSFSKKKLKQVDLENIYGISGEQKEIKDMIKYLFKNQKYFKIILLDGSVGSRDYKPGWSDIDLFIILKNENFSSSNKLKELRRITLKINKFLMRYSILQLHGVIYSTEYHMYANFNDIFPIPCLKTGQIISNMQYFQFYLPSNEISALNYFKNEIFIDSKLLYYSSRIKDLDVLSQVRFLHRIFSFPFTFLQCLGHIVGKKESFDKLIIEYSEIFPGISQFYSLVNQLYLKWKIDKLNSYKFRKILSSFLSLKILNKILLFMEKSIINRVKSYFQFITHNNLLERYNKYLDLANNHLETNFSQYHNPIHPYLKYAFYIHCENKIRKIFSQYKEIVSIYKFGSINALGNSDIDLIFVINDNISLFEKIMKILKTKFTSNEQYVVFQHYPFVIPLRLSQYISYVRPISNPVRIWGKEISFQEIANPYIKLILLVELLIFSNPQPFPSIINRIEDIRIHLQILSAFNFVVKLFREIKEEFNFDSNISFKKFKILLNKNNIIRKNMFNYDLNKIRRHINSSFIFLKKMSLRMRIEIGHFIENKILKKNMISMKRLHPVLKYGNYFFIANEKRLFKIQDIDLKRIDLTRNYYNPWSFYFFFQHQKFLKKILYDSFEIRNKILDRYLKFTSLYNNRLNLYVPFWYKEQFNLIKSLIWRLTPRSLRKKFIFYYYFWQNFHKILAFIILLPKKIIKIIMDKFRDLFKL